MGSKGESQPVCQMLRKRTMPCEIQLKGSSEQLLRFRPLFALFLHFTPSTIGPNPRICKHKSNSERARDHKVSRTPLRVRAHCLCIIDLTHRTIYHLPFWGRWERIGNYVAPRGKTLRNRIPSQARYWNSSHRALSSIGLRICPFDTYTRICIHTRSRTGIAFSLFD